jgi:hypothetical protein
MKRLSWVVGLLCLSLLPTTMTTAADKSGKTITFKKTQLDKAFRSEGVAVADFNGDGKLDIAVGGVYYAAPDWKMIPIVEKPQVFDPANYSDVFCCAAVDVNRDGRPDLVTIGMPGGEAWVYENPGPAGGAWKKHLAVKVASNENPIFADVFGDKRKILVCGTSPDPANPDSPERQMIFAFPNAADPLKPWIMQPFSAKKTPGSARFYHGVGVGDINNDGRNDVVVHEGWWECPKDKNQKEWIFHKANLGEDCAQMCVYDVDGDGDNDVISTSAHRYGVWWHEQTPAGWITHEIDKSISQTHSLILADINGDGVLDIVTGKRWWAHTHGDPGVNEPAMLVWYELNRQGGKPGWSKHVIDADSGVGIQFEVVDINGDGLLDIVVSNKKGVFCFEQVRQ